MSSYVPIECGRFELNAARPLVMGIVNVTPDSFSDGGQGTNPDAAIAHALNLLAQGADILDIGAESTRPGANPVSLEQELQRLLPVLKALRDCGKPISVDTRKPEVMRFVAKLDVDMINDVSGFQSPEAIDALKSCKAAACIMHMRGEPSTMQDKPMYADVSSEVSEFLFRQASVLRAAGIRAERIVIDPGIGFGKTTAHNLSLLSDLPKLAAMQYPVLVGLSRKRFIGELTGQPAESRLIGSVCAAVSAVALGASIVRVHDVAATVEGLKMWTAISQGHAN